MKSGIELIADERQRQVEIEGWTPAHDDEHKDGELAVAGATYALSHSLRNFPMPGNTCLAYCLWPFEYEALKPSCDHDSGRIRELAKAGALIAAEIDRLQRISNTEHKREARVD